MPNLLNPSGTSQSKKRPKGLLLEAGSYSQGPQRAAQVCESHQIHKPNMFLPCPQPMQSAGCMTLVHAMQNHLAKRSLANMCLLSSHLPWQPQRVRRAIFTLEQLLLQQPSAQDLAG